MQKTEMSICICTRNTIHLTCNTVSNKQLSTVPMQIVKCINAETIWPQVYESIICSIIWRISHPVRRSKLQGQFVKLQNGVPIRNTNRTRLFLVSKGSVKMCFPAETVSYFNKYFMYLNKLKLRLDVRLLLYLRLYSKLCIIYI